MPLAVDSLTMESSLQSTREAISSSIAQCMKEGGRTQAECSGMVYGTARANTPHQLKEATQR